MYEYIGHLHLHANPSDCTVGSDDIAEAAGKARLDFVIVPKGGDGWRGRTLVLAGADICSEQGRCMSIWSFAFPWQGQSAGPLKAALGCLWPGWAAAGPDKETLALWDARLAKGRVSGVGGSDAHRRLGCGVNTHVLTEAPFTGDAKADRKLIFSALERGRCFVSGGKSGSARGFSFTAATAAGKALMGDEIDVSSGVKLVVKLSRAASVRVVRDGSPWREGYGAYFMYTAKKPGVYRVEVYRKGLGGKLRAWIFSNPVYVRGN